MIDKQTAIAVLAMLCIGQTAGHAQDDNDISYLVSEGHLPRAHWYSIKPGKHFYLYQLKEGKGTIITYSKVPNVPDIRPLSERNSWLRLFTNVNQWLAPLYGPALTALVAATGG